MKLRLTREDKAKNQAFSCYTPHEVMMDALVEVHGMRNRSELLRQLVEDEYLFQLTEKTLKVHDKLADYINA